MSEPASGVCRYCGCTDMVACQLDDGDTCTWLDEAFTVCSAPECEAKWRADLAAAAGTPNTSGGEVPSTETTEPEQPAADEPRVTLTTEQALGMLTSDSPHVFRQMGWMLIGDSWSRDEIEHLIRDGECELAGPGATAMGHGLAVTLNDVTYFVEAIAATDASSAPSVEVLE